MKNTMTKILGTATGVTLLVPCAVAFAEPAETAAVPEDSNMVWHEVEGTAAPAQESLVAIPNPSGLFSFTQTELTPNWRIKQVFQKASNALCNASSELTVTAPGDWTITVSGDVGQAYTATLGSLSANNEQTKIMGCSCAANIPGGGAVINAEVTGIPFATIIQRAQPLPGVNTITLTSDDGYKMSLPYDYVMSRTSMLSYAINHEGLFNSVGGTNQLWIDSTAAKYFSRNVTEITLSTEEVIPPVPSYEKYPYSPNIGISSVSQ